MIGTENDTAEYPVYVKKGRSDFEEKKLRVLRVRSTPYIQLISSRPNKSNKLKETDISSTAKVFVKFNSGKFDRAIKIITKTEKLEIYFRNEIVYKQCKNNIDNMLMLYHQERQSTSSTYRTSVESDISIKTSPSEDDFPERIPPGPKSGNIEERRESRRGSESYDFVFFKDYDVPEYKLGIPPLKGGYDVLECPPYFKKTLKLDPNIFFVMKKREEILHESGVQLDGLINLLDKISVEVVERKLWISEIKDSNEISGKLHVGDQIVDVNNKVVNDVITFQEAIKNCEICSLIIKRLPKAKVFVFDKSKLDVKSLKTENMKLYFSAKIKSKLSWQVTEFNRKNILNITDPNQISNIQSIINSNAQIFAVIIHPKEFIKSLTDNLRKKT